MLLKDLFEEAKKGQGFNKPRKRSRPGSNDTGFFGTKRIRCRNCKHEYTYKYIYFDEDGNQKSISSIDFLTLRQRVKDSDMDWFINDMHLARKTAKYIGLPLIDLK